MKENKKNTTPHVQVLIPGKKPEDQHSKEELKKQGKYPLHDEEIDGA